MERLTAFVCIHFIRALFVKYLFCDASYIYIYVAIVSRDITLTRTCIVVSRGYTLHFFRNATTSL